MTSKIQNYGSMANWSRGSTNPGSREVVNEWNNRHTIPCESLTNRKNVIKKKGEIKMKSKIQMMIFVLSIMAVLSIMVVTSYAQEVLPFPETPTASTTGKTLADSKHQSRKTESHLPKEVAVIFDMFDKFEPTKNYLVPPIED